MKVVFLSDWFKNPYKELLSAGLRSQGTEACEYEWSTFFLWRVLKSSGFKVGRSTVLHLQTLHPFLRGQSESTRSLKLFIFISQVSLLKLLGINTVWTVHEWSDKMSGGKDELSPFSCRVIGRFLTAFIVHCASTGLQVEEAFKLQGQCKIFVVPHGNYIGCYPNDISPIQARKQLNIASNKTTFLLFGDLYRYKGALEAVDAFITLDADAVLIVAGKPKQDGLEEEIRERIENRSNIVFVPERIPDDEVQLYMNAADCVLVPYTVFTTSGVAVLAMSFGSACMAPNAGFFSDMLSEKGAFLYGEAGAKGLAEAMRLAVLTGPQQLSLMGENNLKLAQQWSWERIGKLTLDVYRQGKMPVTKPSKQSTTTTKAS